MSFIDYLKNRLNEAKAQVPKLAKGLKTWDTYSFSAAGGDRRYKEFVGDLEAAGGEVDPDHHAAILKSGWAAVITGGKNFAGKRAKSILTGAPASSLIYKKGDTSKTIDMTKMERNVRGGTTMTTESKEVCFLLAVQVALDGKATSVQGIIDLIEAFERSSLLGYIKKIQGVEKHEDVLEDILKDPANMRASAVLAVNFLNAIKIGTNYTLHRGSTDFNNIRKRGALLAGLGEDRWNPADVMFIKDGISDKINALLALDSIVEYNSTFNGMVATNDIIPVSLKQTDKAAMGSVAVKKYADIESPTIWSGTPEDAKALTSKIRSLIGIDGLNVFLTWNEKAMTKTTTSMKLTDILVDEEFVEQAKLSDAWNRCYPPVVDWLHTLHKKGGLKDSLAAIALNAMSSGPASATYHKAMDTGIVLVDPSLVGVEIIGIELQINSVSVLVHYKVTKGGKPDGERTAQIRSKGSAPQAIVYNSTRGGGSAVIAE